MGWIGVVRGGIVLLFGASLAVAEEEAPPLSAPALIAPGSVPGTAAPADRPAPLLREATPGTGSSGPVLVIPGITGPGRAATVRSARVETV